MSKKKFKQSCFISYQCLFYFYFISFPLKFILFFVLIQITYKKLKSLNTDKLFFFFQFDFKINLKELKVFLYAIQLYVEIPDYYYDDDDPRMEYHSVRLVIHVQGPKVDWEVVNKTCQNYQIVLEFLLLLTGFFHLFKKLHVKLLYNDPYYKPFCTPFFPCNKH